MPPKTTLNPQQQDAVRTTQGPLLVLAGAGTGKTHTVIERIANIIRNGTPPENILAVTFTNKAAGELKDRLRKRLGRSTDLRDMLACTFHSLCVRILRRDAARLGYAPTFAIIDQGEQLAILRKASRHIRGGTGVRPEDALSEISRLKSAGLLPQEFARRAVEEWEQTLASLYRRYQDALRLRGAFDFDDLLLQAVRLLTDHEDARRHWQERFHHICVDEFQDTSTIQLRLVQILAAVHGNLCVVGDDDQSIYSWRGAVPGNILDFSTHFPGAKHIRLEENYRSTNTILRAANAVIEKNDERHPKTLWSRLGEGEPVRVVEHENQEEEALMLAGEIARRIREGSYPPSGIAVLVRAASQMRAIESEMQVEKIPYVIVGGQSFFDRKEVRDILSFLAVAAYPKDDASLLRIINTPARGIGERTVEALLAWAQTQKKPLAHALVEADTVPGLTPKAKSACTHFAHQIDGWRKHLHGHADLPGLVGRILDETAYADEVAHLYDNPLQQAARLNEAREVGESLRMHLERDPEGGIAGFLQDAMLDGANRKEKKEDNNAVRLITGHSAKGLEFPLVYIAGVEEGIWPHRNVSEEEGGDVSEERRLFYVAMTRAKRALVLSVCRNRVSRNKATPREPSRFLADIPASCLRREGAIATPDVARSHIASILSNLAGK